MNRLSSRDARTVMVFFAFGVSLVLDVLVPHYLHHRHDRRPTPTPTMVVDVPPPGWETVCDPVGLLGEACHTYKDGDPRLEPTPLRPPLQAIPWP